MSNAPGGMPPLNVRIQISTTGAGSAASAMRSVAGASGAMGKSVAGSAVPIRMMGDAMRQTASLIKYSVIGGFVNMGKAAMDASSQMETSLSRIKGLVGESAAQVEIYKQSIMGLAGQTAKSPQELAEALYFITSAGIKGAAALDVLRESARSATAGLGDTQVVADALTSILNAYGEASYSAADANDILVATVREGKAEADQFAPALGKVLPVAAAFGASFEDVSAGVAALTRGGASAGTSAIYLRQVLSQLLKPSKQAAETMMSVGTSAAGSFFSKVSAAANGNSVSIGLSSDSGSSGLMRKPGISVRKINLSAWSSMATLVATSSIDKLKASPVGEKPKGDNNTMAPILRVCVMPATSTFRTKPEC